MARSVISHDHGSADSEGADREGTGQLRKVDRRRFLTYLVAAPTLVVAGRFVADTAVPATADAAIPSLPAPADIIDLGDILKLAGAATANLISLTFDKDGYCHFALPRAEVGQGITTAATILLADELDMPLEKVKVTQADARPELLFNQLTGSSNSIRSIYDPVRALAATARAHMLDTAAKQWNVPADQLTVRDGTISSAMGNTGTYASFAVAAAGQVLSILSGRSMPKPDSELTLVGKPANRIDARDIVTGKKRFTLDLTPEDDGIPANAKPVYVRRPPTINGTVRSVNNEAEVRKIEGILDIAVIATGVAVMAETSGQALDGLNALDVTWGPGTVDNENDDTIRSKLRAVALPLVVPGLLTQHLDAEFDWGFVNHAPLETNQAIADVRADGADIWSAFKTPVVAQEEIAIALGLPQDRVKAHVIAAGGSFGRHLFYDAPLEAALISKAMGKPVKLRWTRTDDIRHGRAAPASYHRMRATFLLGQVASFEHRVASVETDFRHGLGEILTGSVVKAIPVLGNLSIAETLFETTIKSPYNFGLVTQLLTELPVQFHTGSFRSVYSFATRGSEEIMADEMAAVLRQDPLAFRLAFLKNDRQRAVLNKVAKEGQWGKKMAPGTAQGIAYHEEYGSCTAVLVELDATDKYKKVIPIYTATGEPNGTKTVLRPRVTRAAIAVDVGRCVNPRGLEAQMIGGLSDAISIVMRAGVHIVKGAPLEGSYSEFHYARQADSPLDVQVFVMPPTGEPGGAGELGLPAAVGAVANAYARATGTKPRRFPLDFEIDFPPRPPSLSPQPPFRQPKK